MVTKKIPPVHPGEILFEEFLKPMGISQYRLAHDINVPPRRINEIVHGKLELHLNFGMYKMQMVRMSITLIHELIQLHNYVI